MRTSKRADFQSANQTYGLQVHSGLVKNNKNLVILDKYLKIVVFACVLGIKKLPKINFGSFILRSMYLLFFFIATNYS